ncbi:MAG: hypothetical protein FWG70_06520 [Oscillospiraceae bacterium]|nr:hypothetical protein [Oscillospiraceae bacterium]
MYLDPGFGSMLIQVLVASFAALAMTFGIFRQKIVAFFRKGKKGDETSAGDESDE